jgi:hypothetical protein
MSRLLALLLVAGVLGLSGGCAMCCAPLDYNYPSIAGRYVRTNPTSGRVASVFDNAGAPSDIAPATSTSPFINEAPPGATPLTPAPSGTPVPRSVIPRTMGESYLPR